MNSLVLTIFICAAALASPQYEKRPRIVGGGEASVGQFPYQVSLEDYYGYACGGTILDETTIISGALCVIGKGQLYVNAGSLKISGKGGQRIKVKSVVKHELYDNFFKAYDISILKLDEPIEFNENIKPVILRETEVQPGEECIMTGWGDTSTSTGSTSPTNLQYLKVKTIDNETCKEMMKGFLIFDSQICTLTKAGEGACNGDAGGPLVDMDGKLIGVISWGIPCATGRPDVFVRISSLLDWIEQHRH